MCQPCPTCGCDDLGIRNDGKAFAYVGESLAVTSRSGFPLAYHQVLSFPHGLRPGGPDLWAVAADGSDATVSVGPACEHGVGRLDNGLSQSSIPSSSTSSPAVTGNGS
jgi:hypothetical protein